MGKLLSVVFLIITLLLQAPAIAQEQGKKLDEPFLFLMAARNASKMGKYDTGQLPPPKWVA
ncbi:MAG: hypothetical protein ACE5IH_08430 [Thermodesulfobacteriota bacterium]